jgi:ABC-2 type transport system ATP-binding protein
MGANDAVITTRGLTCYYGSKKVVDSVSLSVPRGSVFAFLGRNGSGKTTTIRTILGLHVPTRGSSTVLGEDSRRLTGDVRARVAYTNESHVAYDGMTVRQNGEYQGRFYPRWSAKLFDAVCGQFRLDPKAKAGSLSRGERAGLSLALALGTQPEVLVLDDPGLGLDAVARRALLETMVYVTRDASRTIFFSSHIPEDIERVADHLAILDRSVLRAACSVDDFRAHVRGFVVHYSGAAPATLPDLPGLLSIRRSANDLRVIVSGLRDDTAERLRATGATAIDDMPLGFSEAFAAFLGDRGTVSALFDEPVADALERSLV